MVDVPKTKKSFCLSKACKKNTLHKVTQYMKGNDSLYAQGKRRYDRNSRVTEVKTNPSFKRRQIS